MATPPRTLRDIIPAFFVGPDGQPLTPEQARSREQLAMSLMERATDTSPNAGGWTSVLAKGVQGLAAGRQRHQAEEGTRIAGEQSAERTRNMLRGVGGLGGFGGASMGAPASQPLFAGATPSPVDRAPIDPVGNGVAQAHNGNVNLSGDKQEFISALLPAAIEESKRTGIDPRLIVAQAAQETGWGRSAPGNNFFGIKSHGQSGGQTFNTHEYIDGKRVNIRDSFRQFDSPADSVRGYGEFILNNPRYKPLMAAQGLDAQLEALQASGYATDPNYSRSVGAIARGIPLPDIADAPDTTMTAFAPSDDVAGALASAPFQGAGLPVGGAVDMGGSPQFIYDDQGARMGNIPPASMGNQPYAGPGATIDMPNLGNEVIVAETPEEIMAAEAAMNSPEFAQPVDYMSLPENQMTMTYADDAQPGGNPNGVMDLGPGRPGEKRRGPDGQMYQYVETTGMAGNSGGWGWIRAADDGGGLSGEVAPNDPGMWGMGMDPNDPSTIPAMAGGTLDVISALDPSMGAFPAAPTMGMATPSQVVPQAASGGINPAIIEALSSPYASPQERQIAGMLLQQQMQVSDPMRAIELESAQLKLDQLRNPQPEMTDTQRNLAWRAREAGLVPGTPEYSQFIMTGGKGDGVTVNVGDGTPGLGKLSSDYGYVLDPVTRQPVIDPETGLPRAAPVPGSPADIAQRASEADDMARRDVQTIADSQKSETLIDATQSVLDIMDKADLPVTGTLSRPFALYSGTDAGRVRSYVSALRSGVALGAMQRLKEASATGATGFGALSEKELEILISDIGSLDPDTTEPDIFRKTVERIQDNARRTAESIRKNVSPERIEELGLQSFLDSFGADGGMPKPKSRAEMEALPSGTKFEDPDGNIRVKP